MALSTSAMQRRQVKVHCWVDSTGCVATVRTASMIVRSSILPPNIAIPLRWNPLSGPRWLRFLQSDWIQLAPFVEVGRVAGDYSLAELTSDLKADAGLGIRGMFAGGVARIDCGYSSEGLNIWAMFNQPF